MFLQMIDAVHQAEKSLKEKSRFKKISQSDLTVVFEHLRQELRKLKIQELKTREKINKTLPSK